jgi:tripartite-type tricarboxylate transporter receptor subunit TctC
MLPDTPTIAEAGFPGFELYTFVGYGIHAKTPEPVAKALEALMLKVVAEPGLQEFIKQQPGAEFSGLPGREFSMMIKSDAEKTRGLVKRFGAALRE